MKCPGERRADALVVLVDSDWREVVSGIKTVEAERLFYSSLGHVVDIDSFQKEFREHVVSCQTCGAAYSRYLLKSQE
jgi:hypothetical protein